jgi:transposase
MAARFVNVDRETPMLLPPDLREWVAGDDLVHFIIDAVETCDLRLAKVNQRGSGDRQYPPAMMLGLLIYCYAHRLFSSRQIEQATYHHVSVRFLCGNLHPDHDTVATFRRENGALLEECFLAVLRLARELKAFTKLGTVSVDGTKLGARASLRGNRKGGELEEEIATLQGEIQGLLQEAERADAAPAPEGTALAEQLQNTQARRAALQKAKAQLAARQEASRVRRQQQAQGLDPEEPSPPSCPPRGGGAPERAQRAKAKAAMGQAATPQPARTGSAQAWQPPQSAEEFAAFAEAPEAGTASTSSTKAAPSDPSVEESAPSAEPAAPGSKRYAQMAINLVEPESRLMRDAHGHYLQGYNAQLVVEAGPERSQLILGARLLNDCNDRRALAPALQSVPAALRPEITHVLADSGFDNADLIAAVERQMGVTVLCPPQAAEPPAEPPGYRLSGPRQARRAQAAAMRARLQEPAQQERYRRRAASVEPVFGVLKNVLGFRRFRLFGQAKAQLELTLLATAYNLRRLAQCAAAAAVTASTAANPSAAPA